MKHISSIKNCYTYVILISFYHIIFGCSSIKTTERTHAEYVEMMKASENILLWVYHVKGIQCEQIYYPDIEKATEDLRSHEVEVFDSFDFNIVVTANCGNVTSERFAAQIKEHDLNRARKLGWVFLEDDSIIKNNTPAY